MRDEVLLQRTERWFIRQGVPTLIPGYTLRAHVLPRAVPFLVAACVVAALLVPLLTIWTSAPRAVGWVLGALVVTALVAVVATGYGLVPLTARAARHALSDLRGSVQLQGRALPTLLFVTFFLFFTSELWQLMNRLAWWRLAAVLALFAAVTVLASATRLRAEIERVEEDLNPDRLTAACAPTPLAQLGRLTTPAAPPPLTRRQETNLLLVLATRQLGQAIVVGLGLFVFFLVLGLLIVSRQTAATWIGSAPRLDWFGLPTALVRSAALLAGFGSMYFAITTMTQPEHRREFFEPVVADVSRALAVRAVYLDQRRPHRSPTQRRRHHE